MVTPEDLPRLRDLNFGLRSLTQPVTVERVVVEIGRYDSAEAQAVSTEVRASADLESSLDRLEALYREAIATAAAAPPDQGARRKAMLAFLKDTLPRSRSDGRWPWMAERDALMAQIKTLDHQLAFARSGLQTGGDPE